MYQCGKNIEVEGHIFYRVTQFKYIEILLTQDNKLKAKISKRIQIPNKCYFRAETFLKF